MKISATKTAALGHYGMAALAGLLLSAAFAPWELAGAAWAAPGLMLFCGLGQPGKRTFRLGFVAGFTHFLSSLYWLLAMPFTWLGIPIAPGLAWIGLSAYCGFYCGLWVWFCWKIFPGGAREFPLVASMDRFLAVGGWKRAGWAVVCAAAWTALEFGRGRILSGFPWNILGASQYAMLPLIQIASITGVFGVSFVVVWFSAAVAGALLVLARRPSPAGIWGQAALPLLAVAVLVAFGMGRIAKIPAPTRQIKVALIQPSIPQTLLWDPKEDLSRFQKVIALSEKAMAAKPALLLWPESSVPDFTPEINQAIARLLATYHVWLMFCADDLEPAVSGQTEDFNSAFLVSPAGATDAIYHKRRLVIFGEYVPLLRWLPFLKWLTPIGSGYTAGERPVPFNLSDLSVKTSVLICFEDMFPREAREHVAADTDFLINLTNDGWFGDGPEQKQQAVCAVFRAVENGVPLVRCANNGLTCWIDAQGRIRQVENAEGNIYGSGFITPEIPVGGVRERTIYNRCGDWFAWSCCGLSAFFLAVNVRRKSVQTP